ncbi:right-handed parallel beta-helix repeat-containing protein [Ideonella sp. BN130291]|uniref:right-handed parallel beta-helix repeat-containing protein n=1 Tax=Ideonella sp. BN130291 TaxID=3112940 RepID=UPI002E273D63|nr:right-handed parallel beta-helix repeat-containing protein [Ideonella sp. BN130291]
MTSHRCSRLSLVRIDLLVLSVAATCAVGAHAADTVKPTLNLNAPSPGATTTGTSTSMNGNVSDDVGVSRVDWRNDRGGSGSASFRAGSRLSLWTVDAVALQTGTNNLTVTAYDAAGNATQKTVTVTRSATTPPPPPPPAPPPPAPAPPPSSGYSCTDANVLCVDDTAGATQRYATIQAAASAAKPGNVVLVHSGNYAGFTVSTSGTATQPIRFIANASDVVINRGGNSEYDGVRLNNVSYVQIEGFTIRNDSTSSPRINRCISARGATPTSPMHGNVVRNNTCTLANAEGVYLSQFADGLVEGNTISRAGQNGQARMHGLYLANAGSNNTTIRGNRIFDNKNAEGNGIHANGDLSIGGSGLIRNVVIEGNTIYGNGQSGINMDGVQDSTLQNNLVYGNARHAIRDYQIDAAAGAARLRIVNNTLVATGGWAVKLSEDAGGHVIFNNILAGSSGSLSVGTTTGLVSNSNVVTSVFSYDNESTTVSLSTWRSKTGQDGATQSSTTSALFTNPSAGDYTLSTGSVARNKGVATLNGVSAPPKDIVGTARPQAGAIDIGAYEMK